MRILQDMGKELMWNDLLFGGNSKVEEAAKKMQ